MKLEELIKKFGGSSETSQTPPEYAPKTIEDFIGVLKRTPKTVLNLEQRSISSAAMSFSDRPVKSIMLPKSEVTFVYEHDFLGPLMLDKLYRSGFSHFPVLDREQHIVGILHTESLNSLEIKKTDRASKYYEKSVYFIRADYSLEQAFAAFLRTGSQFLIVIDKSEELVGILTLEMLAEHLLGHVPKDDFDNDSSSYSVAKR